MYACMYVCMYVCNTHNLVLQHGQMPGKPYISLGNKFKIYSRIQLRSMTNDIPHTISQLYYTTI